MLDIYSADEIKSHTLDFLDVVSPAPEYIIIGTGEKKYDIPESVFKRFKERGIGVDVTATFEACSTFNFCSEDDKNICAIIIPA